MTEEIKAHIFEPFFTTKDQGEGTGLGLATCYGIVNRLNGHIEVDSQLGQGTKLKICLPSVAEEIGASDQHQSPPDNPTGSETILLVEDEPLVRALTTTILQEQGYTVLEANNGEEALRIACQHGGKDIHLLLTDVVMPQMGGIELSKKFSSMYPNTQVLLMSGYSDEIITNKAGALDRSIGFMSKPFTPAALTQKTREVLDQNPCELV